jgi:hypothetical protein
MSTIEIREEDLERQRTQRAHHALMLAISEGRLYPINDPQQASGVAFMYDARDGDGELLAEHAGTDWVESVDDLVRMGFVRIYGDFETTLTDRGGTRLEAMNYIAECIGPRLVGGRYYSRYGGDEYTVLAVDRAPETLYSLWTITECTDEEARYGTSRCHFTPWDPRDRVISQPEYVDAA